MTKKLISTSLLLAGIIHSSLAPTLLAAESKKPIKAELESKAKITETSARSIAVAKVPNGEIREGKLLEQNGQLVWSFNVATRGTKNVASVQVDATTGAVLSVRTGATSYDDESPKETHDKTKR